MPNSVKAIFENGVFRPKAGVNLEEHQEVELIILERKDDLHAKAIAGLAQDGKSFSFLSDPAEDVYTAEDGEPL